MASVGAQRGAPGTHHKDRTMSFSGSGGKTRGNGHALKQERVKPHERNKLPPMRQLSRGARCPERLCSPHPRKIFNT